VIPVSGAKPEGKRKFGLQKRELLILMLVPVSRILHVD
jgi:hypothetical protein